ncbi:TPA: hypothetical protein N0F65_001249 [Lagenidium giganteum]|uniref:FMP27 C-terminal domain-containing protein n=1 Tax=Lagenidium giganteum TaxID=4803 RepID=A0AAV2YSI2_9STRA|nr:TPA: hypothetical protein N0F65_001249 [Lagenidium giganteum]
MSNAALAAELVAPVAPPTWHRKWIILVLTLLLVFLYRYRLMGIVLSKAVTVQLSREKNRKERPLICRDVTVSVGHITLHPLQFLHVEVRSHDAWRVVLPRVGLQTYVVDFFMSFAQKKILVLEIDEVLVHVDRIDDDAWRELVHPPSKPKVRPASPRRKKPTEKQQQPTTNPFGFMRFVDLSVHRIHVRLCAQEVQVEFGCTDLSIGIIEVLVKENLLNLRVQLSNLEFVCTRDRRNSGQLRPGERAADGGVELRVPRLCVVVDVEIADRRPIAWKVLGSSEEQLSLRVCTRFVEFLCSKKIELIKKRMFPVPAAPPGRAGKAALGVPTPAIELMDFAFRVTVVSTRGDDFQLPMTCSGELIKCCTTLGDEVVAHEPAADENPPSLIRGSSGEFQDCFASSPTLTAVKVNFVAHALTIKAGEGENQCDDFLFLSSVDCKANQITGEDGSVDCQIGELVMAFNPRIAQALYALEQAQMRVDLLDGEATALLAEYARSVAPPVATEVPAGTDTVALLSLLSPRAGETPVVVKPRLHIDARIISWRIRATQGPIEEPTDELSLHGLATTIHSTVLAKQKDANKDEMVKHVVDVAQVGAELATTGPGPGGRTMLADKHSFLFFGAELSLKKTNNPDDHAKVTQIGAKFKSVSVNGFENDSFAPRKRMPAAVFTDIAVEREETETDENVDVEMNVEIRDADIKWNFEEHYAFLVEWASMSAFMDRLERMTKLGGSPTSSPRMTPGDLTKNLLLSVHANSACVRLLNISHVTSVAFFNLSECKVVHQLHRNNEVNAFSCADVTVLWDDGIPVLNVSNAAVHQKIILGPQRLLAKVPQMTDVAINQVKMFLRPSCRVLFLFLSIDEMVNTTLKPADLPVPLPAVRRATAGSVTLPSSSQSVSLSCKKFLIELSDRKETWSRPSVVMFDDDSAALHNEFHVVVDNLEVKATLTKHFELVESVARALQAVKRDDSNPFVSLVLAVPDLISQILVVDGNLAFSSLTISNSEPGSVTLATFKETELRFCFSEVTRRFMPMVGGLLPVMSPLVPQGIEISAREVESSPARVILFDLSVCTNSCEILAEKQHVDSFHRVVPVFVEALDTSREAPIPGAPIWYWRSQFMGNIDVGLHQFRVVIPYGEARNSSLAMAMTADGASAGLGEKLMVITTRQMALSARQFQKVAFQFQALQITLDDANPSNSAELFHSAPATGSVLLAFVPPTKVDAIVQWLSAEDVKSAVPHFALSMDVVMRGAPVHGSGSDEFTSCVPTLGDALVCINWDYVYPLLVFMGTDDDYDIKKREEQATSPTVRIEDDEFAVICTGVQWNLSLDTVQVIWWDTVTHNAGVLAVLTDVLTHGIIRNTEIDARKLKKTVDPSQSSWVLWETTVYLDQLRAYLLRDAFPDAGVGGELGDGEDVLPFKYGNVADFFWETTGTSYRSTYSAARSTDSDDELEDDVDFRFGDTPVNVQEKLHSSFRPVDFDFSLFGTNKLHRSETFMVMSALNHMSGGVSGLANLLNAAAAQTSPPKSPKSWTQTIRTKMARMKRRTSSMDNLMLNDGSCPIQVDSMKLLWTIETRDSVFYMGSVSVDSVLRLVEAQELQQASLQANTQVPLESSSPPTSSESPPFLSKEPSMTPTSPTTGRRGSTRDTLLELLQQGKLGKTEATTRDGGDSPDKSKRAGASADRRADDDDASTCKPITFKKYTVDMHDAQINILDEASRSSVLVASKHIHMEVGFDDTRSNSIVNLKLDSVTAHVAPLDVDISAGVVWYSYGGAVASPPLSPHAPTKPVPASGSSSALLKQVMDECSLTTAYMETLATGAIVVEADLSFLQLSTDRHQFYQLLNVVRHVLLAPPTIVHRKVNRAKVNPVDPSQFTEVSDISVFPSSPMPQGHSHASDKKLHTMMVEELRNRESRQLASALRANPDVLKYISFRATGGRFRLRSSPETTGADHEFLEIRVEGISGGHTFYENQCTKLQLNLQWMEINNLRPGPSSIAFEDAMSVLKAKLLVDKRYQSSNKVKLTNQKGMLTIRAESGPLIRVLGQKLRVLDVLEVSVFPEISNMIVIQLASDFYDLIYKFFFERIVAPEHHDNNSEMVFFGKKPAHASASSATGKSGRALLQSAAHTHHSQQTQQSTSSSPAPRRRSLQGGSTLNGLNLETSVVLHSASSANTLSASSASLADTLPTDDDESSFEGEELFYFKYVRIGNLRLQINCNGFFVNLSDFDLDLPPYVCQSKLCTWKKLLQKFESHLKWYVTKETASSGLSHFKNKFLKWTPSAISSTATLPASSSTEKKDKKKEEDAAVINAQVLFGAYHSSAAGAPT